jgi:hypothetical protein
MLSTKDDYQENVMALLFAVTMFVLQIFSLH